MQVLKRGVGLSSFSDSELITQMLSLCPPDDPDDWPSRIQNFMESSSLAYSLVIMHADKLYAVRDPFGNRPLCLGRLNRLVNCKYCIRNLVFSIVCCGSFVKFFIVSTRWLIFIHRIAKLQMQCMHQCDIVWFI